MAKVPGSNPDTLSGAVVPRALFTLVGDKVCPGPPFGLGLLLRLGPRLACLPCSTGSSLPSASFPRLGPAVGRGQVEGRKRAERGAGGVGEAGAVGGSDGREDSGQVGGTGQTATSTEV